MAEEYWTRSNRLSRRRVLGGAAAFAGASALAAVAAACGGGSNKPASQGASSSKGNPVDSVDLTGKKVQITFWHAKTGAKADKLNAIVDAYNGSQNIVTVQPQFQGSYTDLYKKLLTSVAGGQLPDLA
jgi:ABC-type glycerol-3-phosphate transport system substrate-binding protein